jgi:hypothetical protein
MGKAAPTAATVAPGESRWKRSNFDGRAAEKVTNLLNSQFGVASRLGRLRRVALVIEIDKLRYTKLPFEHTPPN